MRTQLLFISLLVIAAVVCSVGFQCGSTEMTSARLYIQRSDWDNAIRNLETELAKNPNNEEAWYLLGRVKGEKTDFKGMNDAFDHALKIGQTYAKDIHDVRYNYSRQYEDFRGEFELALDDSNYIRAEDIRLDWLDYLESKPYELLSRKEQKYLKNLRGIVGLADPILVPLRTKLLSAIKADHYDDALKIQRLILNREDQILASTARGEEKPTADTSRYNVSRGNEPIRIEHQNVPRYGATDVGEQFGILLQRRLSDKERAGLKLIDIFLGR